MGGRLRCRGPWNACTIHREYTRKGTAADRPAPGLRRLAGDARIILTDLVGHV